MRNPLRLQDLLREYGDFVLWRGLSDLYFVNHPDLVRHVLSQGAEHFSKRTLDYRVLSQYLGDGLATSDGELWAKQRRLIQPFFGHKNLARFDQGINALTSYLVDEWAELPREEIVWLDRDMRRLTLRTAGVTMLGLDIEPHIDELNRIVDVVNRQPRDLKARMTLVPWFPTPHNFKMQRALKQLDRIVFGLIEARQRGPEGDDILYHLVQEHGASAGSTSSRRQTRDEIVTFMISGNATTATALAWTLHLIATNPDVQAQLAENLADRLSGAPATTADLPRIPYLQRVVQEALRLYPPIWCYTRRSEQEHEFGDYTLPAKAHVGVLVYALHRHPEFWPDPERFDPDRFHPSRSKNRHFYSYLPFAAGPRTCVGGGLAMLQIQLVLAQILQRFRIHPLPDHPVEPVARVTLEPRNGIPVTLTPR